MPLSALPLAAIFLAGEGPRDRGSGRGSDRAGGAGVLVAGRMLSPRSVHTFPAQTRGGNGSTLSAVTAGRQRDRVISTRSGPCARVTLRPQRNREPPVAQSTCSALLARYPGAKPSSQQHGYRGVGSGTLSLPTTPVPPGHGRPTHSERLVYYCIRKC